MSDDATATDEPVTDGPASDQPASDATATVAEPEPGAAPALVAGPDQVREARWTRLILPIALPIGAAFMIAVFVINVSRIFLATGSTGAIVLATTLIVLILGGAAGISAAPRLRTSSIVMMVSVGLIVLISAGLVAAPATVEEKAGGGNGLVNPAGPAKTVITVDALPTTKFQATQFSAAAGIVQFDYVSFGVSHTLAIDDSKYASFLLNVPPTAHGKVLFKPGTYTIYCTLPGHRALGMQATVTVS